jgi:hypothetical protein
MEKSTPETPLQRCKLVLEEFFLNCDYIPICSDNCTLYLDDLVAKYLVKSDHNEFLVEDISYGPMVGGVSERALIDFAREGKVFDGKDGKYKLRETYGPHSSRMFEAWKA